MIHFGYSVFFDFLFDQNGQRLAKSLPNSIHLCILELKDNAKSFAFDGGQNEAYSP